MSELCTVGTPNCELSVTRRSSRTEAECWKNLSSLIKETKVREEHGAGCLIMINIMSEITKARKRKG